jgi:hypothetical protein
MALTDQRARLRAENPHPAGRPLGARVPFGPTHARPTRGHRLVLIPSRAISSICL